MKLLVNIPAFNEETTISRVVSLVPREIPGISEVVVQVVDDGSVDGTRALAEEAGAVVISHPRNLGLGMAFHTGIRAALAAGADYFVNIDGDGQFDPRDIPKLIAPLTNEGAHLATCSRFKDASLVPEMPRIKIWGNRLFALIISAVVGQRYWDVSCGFRAFTREALLRLNLRGQYTHTHESFLDLRSRGLPIVEVPLAIRGTREFGGSRVASNLFRYGARSLMIIFRAFRDFQPLKFFSWLAAPFVLASVLLFAISLSRFFSTGTWVKWAAFTAAASMGFAVMLFFLGVVSEMLDRIRFNTEEILYFERSQVYDRKARRDTPSPTPNQDPKGP
ncbi:MAG: glycosyltransferase family 2 protein [Planctomycetota bacterium]